jgi:hypothetical protein
MSASDTHLEAMEPTKRKMMQEMLSLVVDYE